MKRSVIGLMIVSATVGIVGCGEDKGAVPEARKEAVVEAVPEPEFVPGQYYASDKGFFERRRKAADAYPTLIDFSASYYDFDEVHRLYPDLYLANTQDVPAEVWAEIVDPQFREVTDSFARKDRLAELAPKIEEYKKKVAAISPNVTILPRETIAISPYNIERETFSIEYKIDAEGAAIDWTAEHYSNSALNFGISTTTAYFKAARGENTYEVKVDEATARKLEGYLSQKRSSATQSVSMPFILKGYVLDTVAEGRNFVTIVMPEVVEVIDPDTREVYLTLGEKDLAPKFRLTTRDFSSSAISAISKKYDLDQGRF